MSNPIAQQLNAYLARYNVLVKFLDPVIDNDLPRYDRGQVIDILTAIVKRFEDNANPHQIVEKWKLKGDLFWLLQNSAESTDDPNCLQG